MIKILFLLFSTFAALLCEEGERSVRGMKRSRLKYDIYNCDIGSCEDPCNGQIGPQIEDFYWSPRDEQLVKEEIVLICTPGSYFSEIIIDKFSLLNISCNEYQQQEDIFREVNYIGITNLNARRVELRGDPLIFTLATINGNAIVSGRAPLIGSECESGLVLATAILLQDEPTVGCYDQDTPSDSLTAVAYELKIYEKCCSSCSLQKGSIKLQRDINK